MVAPSQASLAAGSHRIPMGRVGDTQGTAPGSHPGKGPPGRRENRVPREEPAAEMGDGAAAAAGSSPLPAGMARRGGRGLAAEGKEARAGKSGLFLAAVSVLTLDNPVPQFTTAQQPACSGGRRRAASPGRGGGSKVTPKPAAGALQGKATNPSCVSPCPAGLPLQGRANAARTPRSCRRRFLRMREENPNAEKSLPIPDQRGHSASRAPSLPGPAPARFLPKGISSPWAEAPPHRQRGFPNFPSCSRCPRGGHGQPRRAPAEGGCAGRSRLPPAAGDEGIASAPPQREALGPRTGSGEDANPANPLRSRSSPSYPPPQPFPGTLSPGRDAPRPGARIHPGPCASPPPHPVHREKGGRTRKGGPAAAPQTPARPSRAHPGGEHPAAALTLDGQPAGAEHTCYQSGHIPNHSTTGPRCAASSARRAARPGRGGAGPGWPWPGRARRGWRGRRGGSEPAARRCAHARAHPRAAPHLRSAARCSLACAL